MKKIKAIIWVTLLGFMMGGLSYAADRGTAAEAEAMVKKAITYFKTNGKDKAFAEINNRKGQFVDRDLYISVYDLTGTCVAHGAIPAMIGKDMIGLRDPDGVFIVKDRMELAKTKEKFWQSYKFTNPVSKKIESKSMYCEKFGDFIFACGVYKK